MEILIIWLFFGIISAVVASTKGRSAFGWFVIGILFGPLGFILALVIQEKKVVQSEPMRKCPYCAELIKLEALKCHYCGTELSEEDITKAYNDYFGGIIGKRKAG